MNEMNLIILLGFVGYVMAFVLFVNILDLTFGFRHKKDQHEHCVEGNCKNKCFGKSEYCYWHHPTRKALAPIGSEVTPRRSLRIALKNHGMYVDFPPESKIQ